MLVYCLDLVKRTKFICKGVFLIGSILKRISIYLDFFHSMFFYIFPLIPLEIKQSGLKKWFIQYKLVYFIHSIYSIYLCFRQISTKQIIIFDIKILTYIWIFYWWKKNMWNLNKTKEKRFKKVTVLLNPNS